MKKSFLYLFTMLCALSFFTACDDDDSKDPNGLDVNTTYSGDKLDLKNGNLALLGKEIIFDTQNGKTATITMRGSADYLVELLGLFSKSSAPFLEVAPGVIPGETYTTLSNVPLTLSGEKYTFEGTDSSNGREFKYSGSVEKDKLTMTVDDIRMPHNDLVGNWNLQPAKPLNIVWKSDYMIDLSALGKGKLPISVVAPELDVLVGPLLQSVLQMVVFGGDGNIVASYKKKGSSEWQSSPLNLAQYYVKDNVMYVQLNIAQILATVEANRSKAEMPGFDLSLIKYLAQYLSKGIPLDYSVTGGNARITANKELLMQLLPVLANEKIQELLLPKLSEIIPNEIKPVLLPIVQELFTNLPEILEKTEDISVTLNLLEK